MRAGGQGATPGHADQLVRVRRQRGSRQEGTGATGRREKRKENGDPQLTRAHSQQRQQRRREAGGKRQKQLRERETQRDVPRALAVFLPGGWGVALAAVAADVVPSSCPETSCSRFSSSFFFSRFCSSFDFPTAFGLTAVAAASSGQWGTRDAGCKGNSPPGLRGFLRRHEAT